MITIDVLKMQDENTLAYSYKAFLFGDVMGVLYFANSEDIDMLGICLKELAQHFRKPEIPEVFRKAWEDKHE